MVVLIMERVPASLRGELSRWLIEPKAGVFVGRVSATVRDKLWEQTCKKARKGSAVLLFSSVTEQGFSVRTFGEASRALIDVEGLVLVRLPAPPRPNNALSAADP